jgi:uncharacterized protein with GYD domain
MAMYIVLGHITDEGAKNMNQFASQVEQNISRAESSGIKVHGWYMTQGRYDFVVVAEAPNDEVQWRQAFAVAGSGMARTETMHAYTLDEVRRLIPS